LAGLAFIIGEKDVQKIGQMIEKIRHRGVDHSEIFIKDNASFGCCWKEGEKALFESEDGRYICLFDGEIYNADALKMELTGHEIHSLEEVLLHLYEEVGEECVKFLEGNFVFAVYDSLKNAVFVARDPLGIKPLYYGKIGNGLAFASEIKALQQITEDINEFPNGYFYNGKEFMKYFSIPQDPFEFSSAKEIVEGLRLRLEDSVKKRLTDENIGLFISGGLDSSLVAAIATKYRSNMFSFAVGVEDSPDIRNSRLVAEYLKTCHKEFIYTEKDIKEVLPKVIYHLESCDPALVRSAVANYFASKLASEYVDVVFSGEGADELFAGYHYLKNYEDPWELHKELKYITSSVHNTNSQRLDRMGMAFSLKVRVPFLDLEVLRYAFRIRPSLKIRGKDKTEKWILRKLAEDYLPSSIVWRKKEKFSIGSGTAYVLKRIAESQIKDTEYLRNRVLPNGFEIKSKEEMYYFKILKEFFNVEDFIEKMGRSRSLNDNQIYA